MKKVVVFVVVGWNNKDIIGDSFKSILSQTYKNIRVIYVDNGSKDNSLEYIKNTFPDVICIDTGKNNGFARGNNIGIKEALKIDGVEFIAFLNSDANIQKDWTKKLVDFSVGKKRIAAMQGVTLDHFNHTIIDSTHIFLARTGQATQGSYRDQHINVPSSYNVFGVNCAAAMFTREFIDNQPYKNLFDEKMFMYLEDVDVAFRSIIMGYKNYCVNGAFAYHMGSASSSKNKSYPTYMTFRNNAGMIIKNIPLQLLLKIIPRIAISDYSHYKNLRRLGRKGESMAMVKGRLVSILLLPHFIIKRFKLSGKRTIDNRYLWYLMRKGY